MFKSIKGRLAAVARQLRPRQSDVQEIIVRGGLTPGVSRQARIVGGPTILPETGEKFDQFRQRVRAIAESTGAKFVVHGGLPDSPGEWAVPPGMDEALARANRPTDEIDADPNPNEG